MPTTPDRPRVTIRCRWCGAEAELYKTRPLPGRPTGRFLLKDPGSRMLHRCVPWCAAHDPQACLASYRRIPDAQEREVAMAVAMAAIKRLDPGYEIPDEYKAY